MLECDTQKIINLYDLSQVNFQYYNPSIQPKNLRHNLEYQELTGRDIDLSYVGLDFVEEH